MRKILFFISIFSIFGCISLKQNGNELLNNNNNVEIVNFLSVNNSDSIYISELRLHSSYALFTMKYLYKKFGKWNEVVIINNHEHYLVWKNCNLFEGKDDVYTVAASGVENMQEAYSSVIVWNKNNENLLSEKSKLRDTLVSMFFYGTKRLTYSNGKFSREYWKMREDRDDRESIDK